MSFRRWFMVLVCLFAAGFAALLPYAHSVARDIRRCRDQFPADLARFEAMLRAGDLAAVYDHSTEALRRSVTQERFVGLQDRLMPPAAGRLQSLGDYSAFGWQAAWVDEQGKPVADFVFQFWWEEDGHKLRRVPGVIEPGR